MTDDKLLREAAIERCRRIHDGETLEAVYGDDSIGGITPWECWDDDRTTLVNHYLALAGQEGDGEQPIDEAWFVQNIGKGWHCAMVSDHVGLCCNNRAEIYLEVNETERVSLPNVKLRSQARRLLAALRGE